MAIANSTADKVYLDLTALQKSNDQIFLILMGMLIFFMQCGFAFLEAGAVRSKNTTNILIKNVLDGFLGALAYWLFGYSFAFANESNAFIGHWNFAMSYLPLNLFSKWFFQFVFAATAATIVSGAMAERTEFMAYLFYSCLLTGFIYPVVTHWGWDGNGWLSKGLNYDDGGVTVNVPYQDFAGSGIVHVVGGTCALVGAAILGPRIGRFVNGKPVTIPGHTVPMTALGGFILFMGFLAFNGGSQAQMSQAGDAEAVALSVVNTIIAGAGGAVTALFIKRIVPGAGKNWSLLTTINGGLTGMVSICAGCNAVYPYCALVIGILGGMTYVLWSAAILKMKIDDPLDSCPVHMGGGVWGVLAVPLFNYKTGILYRWNKYSFYAWAWNIVGLLAIMAWSAGCAALMFGFCHLIGKLRVPEDIERKGLDIPKHGEPAYPVVSYGDGWNMEEYQLGPGGFVDKSRHVNGNSSEQGPVEAIAIGKLDGDKRTNGDSSPPGRVNTGF
ncbi:putative ammonium transporter 1 isoform X2 [Nematostella vectensis]|uniref:putative ammonium transporter 1 isoform X2 n=1 Tax=Nematostella vectensis TaxID=45351 RepID=UPI0013905F8E|nr:putative ammonium transporter 1 isoform X2 [Nematostella vectensis]